MRVPFVKSLVGSLHRSSFAHTSIEASGTLPTEANPRRALHPTARELHATHATRRERSARELATSPRGRRNGSHAASIRVGATRTEAPETYAVRLEAQPAPRQLHHDATDVGIARARDALVMVGLSTLIGRRHQPDEGRQFATILNLAPPEDFGRQDPPAHRTDGTERLQLDERCVGGCCRIR